MTDYCSGRRNLVGFSSRKMRISSEREHQLRITIGQMVDDLELIAAATSKEEWCGKIEYLPIG
jgi:hypothetical protein